MSEETKFYLQTYAEDNTPGDWEQVDDYIYKNWKSVVDPETNEPRYTGNKVIHKGNNVSMEIDQITTSMLGIICRLCGVTIPQHISKPGGFAPMPTELLTIMKKGNKTPLLYHVPTGNKLRKVA